MIKAGFRPKEAYRDRGAATKKRRFVITVVYDLSLKSSQKTKIFVNYAILHQYQYEKVGICRTIAGNVHPKPRLVQGYRSELSK